MTAFDLQKISSVAPIGDLEFGMVMLLGAVIFAHAVFIPKLYCSSPWRALTAFAASAVASLAVVATLSLRPSRIYFAYAIYAALFCLLGFITTRGLPALPLLRKRAAIGSVAMLISGALAWWVAFAPR